jgi:4-diphosphocytidyl-2-C-methyl-D-erythritol kinase
LESLVVFAADVGDTVKAAPAPQLSLRAEGPFASSLRATKPWDNLVVRACRALAGLDQGIEFDLVKRIPVAAGLGGGSADGAATLRVLNRLLQLNRTPAELDEIAVALGADVPMCLLSRPAIARGIGGELTPVALPAMPVVMACPPVELRTQDVFRALDQRTGTPLPPLPKRTDVGAMVDWLRTTGNDLAAPAARVLPDAVAAAAALAAEPTCLLARMTGSGPAAFGIFQSREAAEQAAARLRALRPTWWVIATTTGGA